MGSSCPHVCSLQSSNRSGSNLKRWFPPIRNSAVLTLYKNASSPLGYKYHWFYGSDVQEFKSYLCFSIFCLRSPFLLVDPYKRNFSGAPLYLFILHLHFSVICLPTLRQFACFVNLKNSESLKISALIMIKNSVHFEFRKFLDCLCNVQNYSYFLIGGS